MVFDLIKYSNDAHAQDNNFHVYSYFSNAVKFAENSTRYFKFIQAMNECNGKIDDAQINFHCIGKDLFCNIKTKLNGNVNNPR